MKLNRKVIQQGTVFFTLFCLLATLVVTSPLVYAAPPDVYELKIRLFDDAFIDHVVNIPIRVVSNDLTSYDQTVNTANTSWTTDGNGAMFYVPYNSNEQWSGQNYTYIVMVNASTSWQTTQTIYSNATSYPIDVFYDSTTPEPTPTPSTPPTNSTGGTWETVVFDEYSVVNGNSPTTGALNNTANFNIGNVGDFNGWSQTFTVESFIKTPLASYSFENRLNFFAAVAFTGATGETEYCFLQLSEFSTWFGWGNNRMREITNIFTPSNYTTATTGVWYDSVNSVTFYLSRVGNSLVYTFIDSVGTQFGNPSGNSFHDNRSRELPSDWFTSVNVTVYVGWNGQGSFDISSVANEYTGSDTPVIPPEIPYTENSNWLTDLLDFIGSAAVFLFQIAKLFVGFIMFVLPYMTIIVTLTFVEALINIVHTQSPRPLMAFFEMAWDYVASAYDQLSNIAQVVAEALPF